MRSICSLGVDPQLLLRRLIPTRSNEGTKDTNLSSPAVLIKEISNLEQSNTKTNHQMAAPPPLRMKTTDEEVDLKELQRKRELAEARLDQISRVLSAEPASPSNPFLHYADHFDLLSMSCVHSSLRDMAPPQMRFAPMSSIRRQAVVDILPLWGGGALGLCSSSFSPLNVTS